MNFVVQVFLCVWFELENVFIEIYVGILVIFEENKIEPII